MKMKNVFLVLLLIFNVKKIRFSVMDETWRHSLTESDWNIHIYLGI